MLQRDQRLVRKPSDRSQRMIRPNPLLKVDVAEKLASPLIPTPEISPYTTNRALPVETVV